MIAARAVGVAMALAAVLPTPASAQKRARIPASFGRCAAKAVAAMRADEDGTAPKFGCTRAYFDALPNSGGNTVEMGEAFTAAREVGDAYIDQELVPAVGKAFGTDDDGNRRRAAMAALVIEQRAYAKHYCELIYDIDEAGTIRSIAYGGCMVAFTDQMVDDLVGLLTETGNV